MKGFYFELTIHWLLYCLILLLASLLELELHKETEFVFHHQSLNLKVFGVLKLPDSHEQPCGHCPASILC